MAKKEKWVQEAIQRPGRVRNYLKRVYGDKAFNKDGSIKMSYIDKAIQRVENSKMPKDQKKSLLSALRLAKRLKRGL